MIASNSLFLHHDKGLRLLRWQWKGAMHPSQFRSAFFFLIELSEKQDIRRWLVDTSDMPMVGIDEQAWLSEEWLPRFAELKVTDIAIILPASMHNQLVVETVLSDGQRYECGEIQFFSDSTSALDWLTNSSGRGEELEAEWAYQHQAEIEKYKRGLPSGSLQEAERFPYTF
ncbi:hypothetical protein E5K00_20810 [Hymenobacter aquaticus]|uniref:STAS/SEC14 domain-containing protein n=1 Tax=Hymenobacter aquaticus TaxID=1867101 RepID=A0A4Z0PTV6_9BACT|nr:hypothetical protein [Hymenobacter aquaticus]TGE20441.1 hypothetical protein E5K00_20810 [Hymenobacter aquaticus]